MDYTIEVERGPVVDIRVGGLSAEPSKLKRYVPVWEEHAVDEDLLNEGRRNLRDYLQEQGYFDADGAGAAGARTAATRQLHIVYSIQPGERHTLRAIELEGNKRFDTATLRERMGTQVSSMLLPHGRYSQSLLANDLQAIKTLYQANGYPSVQGDSEVMDDYPDGTRGDMKLVVKVDEGPLVRVGTLEIRGAHAVSARRSSAA